MAHELAHAVVTAGAIEDEDLGSHGIHENRIEVEDAETAHALVARYRGVEWHSEPPEREHGDTPDEAEESAEAPFSPGEFTVDELEARLADSDHTDAEREALANAERDGENRDSAIEVLAP